MFIILEGYFYIKNKNSKNNKIFYYLNYNDLTKVFV